MMWIRELARRYARARRRRALELAVTKTCREVKVLEKFQSASSTYTYFGSWEQLVMELKFRPGMTEEEELSFRRIVELNLAGATPIATRKHYHSSQEGRIYTWYWTFWKEGIDE